MIFRVVIVAIEFLIHTLGSRFTLHRNGSSEGVRLSVSLPISKNTETAPNSYAGSGQCVFPCEDGDSATEPRTK